MDAKPLARSILAAALVLVALTAHADLTGKVVAVADGDTITILDAGHKQHRIRINGIDAPEKAQPFGDRSRQNMASMVAGKEVVADCHKTDRYGRQICKVWVRPADCPTCGLTLDVGYAQIAVGFAWWYREYAREQTAEDRGRYESEENEARLRKRGLWADKEPVPPWEWRRRSKNSSQAINPIQHVAFVNAQAVTTIDKFFQNLKRPASPNNWLVAPADFVVKPDAVAPIFYVPLSELRQAFKAAILQSKEIAVVAESENAMHLVATTRLMRFQDDIRVLFIPVASDKSTIALYSASRVGYWDLGTNRRRVEDLIKSIGSALASAKNEFVALVVAMETKMKIADPLATVQPYLQLNPDEGENRALRKLLQYLVNFDGTLYSPESVLFQGELGELTAALIDARIAGRYAVEEWQQVAAYRD